MNGESDTMIYPPSSMADQPSGVPKLQKPAVTSVPIHPLLKERWSPRAFDNHPIPTERLLSILEAARWSPSAGNGQPWSFIIFQRSDEEEFMRAVSCLNEGNVVWAQHAPLLMIAVAQVVRETGAPNRTALYDLGQAVAHLSVQAESEGLAVHQMGGFDQSRARELFNIPEGYEPVTFIAVGELGSHISLPESLQVREIAPRTRKPLNSFVWEGDWGRVAPLVEQEEQAPV